MSYIGGVVVVTPTCFVKSPFRSISSSMSVRNLLYSDPSNKVPHASVPGVAK